MKMKSCGKCKHAMAGPNDQQVYCIAHPAVPIALPSGLIVTRFPEMMIWGKCDEHAPGAPQAAGEPPAPARRRKGK